MRRTRLLLFAILVLVSFCVSAQQLDLLSLHASVAGLLPLGESTALYTVGGAASLAGDITLGFAPALFARLGIDAALLPTWAGASLTTVGVGAGLGVQLHPFQRLGLRLAATGGYNIGIHEETVGSGPYFAGGLDLSYELSPAFSIGLGASYRQPFALSGGEIGTLYSGLAVSLRTEFHLGAARSRSNIEFDRIELDPVFPVFYKYYGTHPIGTVTLRNGESGPIEDLSATLFVSKYMDQPTRTMRIMEVGRDEEVTLDLRCLFNDQILELTESTVVAAQIVVSYTFADEERVSETVETIRIYNRNNITWDDDDKAAAFVSSTDPTVMRFSRGVDAAVRDLDSQAINDTFRSAMAMFESLRLFGMNYVVDPASPYEELSSNAMALDYLQFPRQTLQFRAGDCDDLSILYCALLESIGIRTAFVTIPGHIYAAVLLDMDPVEAERTFNDSDLLIVVDDSVWLPVEITMLDSSFLQAWQYGAREWWENEASGDAQLHPVHSAWQTYEPVGFLGEEAALQYPDEGAISDVLESELSDFVERQISPMISELRERISGASNPLPLQNRLGVLYARYGLLDQAETEFAAAADRGYVPAIVNLGNVYRLRGDSDRAAELLMRANREQPNDPQVLLAISAHEYSQGDYDEARRYYEQLTRIDEELADRNTYLGGREGVGRASDVTSSSGLPWME